MANNSMNFYAELADFELDEEKIIISTEEMLKILEVTPLRCLSWL